MRYPDFSRMPKLEDLIMECCRELKEVHGSIGVLESLFTVNLKDCVKLRGIPDRICRVKSLRYLDISGCSMIDHLPDDFGDLTSLMEFNADGAPITNLPRSFANLKNLSRLSLYGYNRSRPSSILSLVWSWISKKEAPKENNQLINVFPGLRSLVRLKLEECDLSDDGLLESIGTLRSLKQLQIVRSNLRHLPSSISSLSNLQQLFIRYCPKIEALVDVHPNISEVYCVECPSLAEISFSGQRIPEGAMVLEGCRNLSTKCINDMIKSQRPVSLGDLSDDFMRQPQRLLYIPGSEIPEWFEYQGKSTSLSFPLPSCHGCELTKVTVSCILRPRIPSNFLPLGLVFGSTATERVVNARANISYDYGYEYDDYYIGVFSVLPSVSMGDTMQYAGVEVALEIEPDDWWTYKAVGVHLEVEKCQKCCLICDVNNEEDDAEPAGPISDGRSSSDHLMDLPVNHRWFQRFVKVPPLYSLLDHTITLV